MDHPLENVVGILAVMAVFGNGPGVMATDNFGTVAQLPEFQSTLNGLNLNLGN
jgi:hypothetical protein